MNKTTELGLQSVMFLAQQCPGYLVNPHEMAKRLGESPTYMAKVLRLLARNGLVRSHRGASGGFELVRGKADISLLEIVEACQGPVRGYYCQDIPADQVPSMCGYHQAMHELKESCRTVLLKWKIADILIQPVGRVPPSGCRLRRAQIQPESVPA